MDEKELARLQRRLAQRDRRIAGLVRRVSELESKLARSVMLPRDIERTVQQALCNVRMIPVTGLARTARVVEVRAESTPQPADQQADQH